MAGTGYYKAVSHNDNSDIKQILLDVYAALEERGLNPVDQLIGYIESEDPIYITTHKNARKLMQNIDKYTILDLLINEFIKANKH